MLHILSTNFTLLLRGIPTILLPFTPPRGGPRLYVLDWVQFDPYRPGAAPTLVQGSAFPWSQASGRCRQQLAIHHHSPCSRGAASGSRLTPRSAVGPC